MLEHLHFDSETLTVVMTVITKKSNTGEYLYHSRAEFRCYIGTILNKIWKNEVLQYNKLP